MGEGGFVFYCKRIQCSYFLISKMGVLKISQPNDLSPTSLYLPISEHRNWRTSPASNVRSSRTCDISFVVSNSYTNIIIIHSSLQIKQNCYFKTISFKMSCIQDVTIRTPTVCTRSLDPFYIVTHYLKSVNTSWLYIIQCKSIVAGPGKYPK